MSARFTLAAASLLAAPILSLSAQSGIRYTVSMSGERKADLAVVTVLGERSHIQPFRRDDDAADGPANYLIIRDGKLYSVQPDKHDYSVSTAEEFENVVGTALRSVSPMVKMHVDDTEVTSQELADGEKILGYRTRHYRVTQQFTISVSAFGFDGAEEPVPHQVVTDYWVADEAKLPRNPLVELIASAPSAPAQQSRSFTRETARVRNALFSGMPLRIVVRSSDKGNPLEEKARIEVKSLERTSVNPQLFEIPDGYVQTPGLKTRLEL